jgi:hypothetical protein
MLGWIEALTWPAIVLLVNFAVLAWKWRWRRGRIVAVASLTFAVLVLIGATVEFSRFVGNSKINEDDYVGGLIAIAVFGWFQLLLLAIALVVVGPFDRWRKNA